MIRRPPGPTQRRSSAASDVYKRQEALSTRGILLNPLDMQRMRIVTNYHVTPADVEQVLDTFQELMRGDVVAAGGGAYIYG